MGCASQTETDRGENCIACSKQIAARDLDVLAKYKTNITTAAEEKCFPAALLAAFISRATMASVEIETKGVEYQGTQGWLYCHHSHKMCYGLMRLPESEFFLYKPSSRA